MRTSSSHPLRIDALPVGPGQLGLTFCPGKTQPHAMTGPWARDLGLDFQAIKAFGASALVTLMESHELEGVKAPADALKAQADALGIEWHHLPIRDVDVPGEAFETAWAYSGTRLHSHLRQGRRVVLHCLGGRGRTGTIAARILVEAGTEPAQAIAEVRQAREETIETPDQEAYARRMEPLAEQALLARERLTACVLGGAVGDGFGYAVEFLNLAAIKQRHGPQGLQTPQLAEGRLIVSDDTQMTLFTLEGLLRAFNGGPADPERCLNEIRAAYLDWLTTQGNAKRTPITGWLAGEPALRASRAPGGTCLSALGAGGVGTTSRPINDSKGCGGVMRTAPIGFFFPFEAAFRLGAEAAALTHGHPSGYLTGGAVAALVRLLCEGRELSAALPKVLDLLSRWKGHEEASEAIKKALRLAEGQPEIHEENVRALGEGWVGEEALAVAIYACLVARDYRTALAITANHDGDSDSTASIAGQIWGAWKGVEELPHEWVMALDVLQPTLKLLHQAHHQIARQGFTPSAEEPKVPEIPNRRAVQAEDNGNSGFRMRPIPDPREVVARFETDEDGLLFARLARGGYNQSDLVELVASNPELRERLAVTFSRYGIWAQTAANDLDRAIEQMHGSLAVESTLTQKLASVSRTLRAFVALQEAFSGDRILDG